MCRFRYSLQVVTLFLVLAATPLDPVTAEHDPEDAASRDACPRVGDVIQLDGLAARVVKLDMLPYVESEYTRRFHYDSYENPKITLLRETYTLERVVAPGKDEFDRQVHLMDWTHRQFGKFGRPTSDSRGALDVLRDIQAGHTFFCAHYARLFVSAAASLGWIDRAIALRRHQDAAGGGSTEHTSTEIWSNQYRKWIMLDPTCNMYLEKDGVPLNAVEIRQEWFYEDGRGLVFVIGQDRRKYRKADLPIFLRHFPGFGDLAVNPDELDKYGFIAYIPNTNFMDAGEDYGQMFIVKDQLCEGTKWHQRTVPEYPATDPYFPLGQSTLTLQPAGDQMEVSLKTMTPNFQTFEIRVDDGEWKRSPARFKWPVHVGDNKLRVRTLNQFGVHGPVSTVEIGANLPMVAHGTSQAEEPACDRLVLVEAEGFAQRGGWVVDPQFMDQMGSPYLLAHGLGRPVEDAMTEVDFPTPGVYRVWVRTKDWVAPWNAPGAPGKFQVLVGGKPLGTTFGTEGAQWHWQDGGQVEITERRVRVALHDLTGFEGRCDAILFARDKEFTPPNADPEMATFRRGCLGLPEHPEPAGEFDFVVTGGGIAGTCAAISAARLGLKVALVQDRPVLGGNNSSEVRVWLQGARNKEPWPRIGDVVAELEQDRRAHYGPTNTADLYEDEKKIAVVRGEPNIRLFLEHRVNAVETAAGSIRAVVAQQINTGRRERVAGRWFADCTGDAVVGALAGADFEIEPKGRMGPCNLWNVCECKDTNAINTATTATAEPQPFPRCPWALDLTDKPFPGRSKTKPDPLQLGGWYWESGFDRHPIDDMEHIRDWNFRAMYGAWDAMKNVDKVLPNHRLNWSAHILGKRESRRLMGDVVLCFEDLKDDRQFSDGCAPTGWSNDLHLPDPRYEKGFEGDAFIARANFGEFPAHREQRPFWVPYRCLYSRNIANLFMAGRDISVTHDALGAVRVMRTGGCMGEVVGMAASLCKQYDTTPREVYERHLAELQDLMRRGVGKTPEASPDYENQGEGRKKREETPIGQTPAME